MTPPRIPFRTLLARRASRKDRPGGGVRIAKVAWPTLLLLLACTTESTAEDGGSGAGTGASGAGAEGGGGGPQGGGPQGGGGAGGEGGGPVGNCMPGAMPIDDTCGVFVKMGGAPGAAGTQNDPLGNLTSAIEDAAVLPAGRKNVYICDAFSAGTTISLPNGVSIFGQLDCDDWTWSAAADRPLIRNSNNPAVPTVTVEGASTLYGLRIEAADASGEDPGTSSIGVLVLDGGVLTVEQSEMSASTAAPGALGGAPPASGNLNGSMGTSGENAVCATPADTGNGGAGGPPKDCPGPDGLQSGKGGNGGDGSSGMTGGPAESGESVGLATGGPAGSAQTLMPAQSCANGMPGGSGALGAAAPTTEFGTLDIDGYVIPVASEGGFGRPGAGGGGGGGGARCSSSVIGAGAGGGGGGGCGGAGGISGRAAGASFGIALIGAAQVSLSSVSIVTSNGSTGGAGGAGEAGGNGGQPGTTGTGGGTSSACNGGLGGAGGQGGGGAGGAGGLSAPIATTSELNVTIGADVVLDAGTPGNGGTAGMPNGMAGPPGVACEGTEVLVLIAGAAVCETPPG